MSVRLCTCLSFPLPAVKTVSLYSLSPAVLLSSTDARKQFVYPGEMGMAGLYGSHVASDLELSRYISPDDLFCRRLRVTHEH